MTTPAELSGLELRLAVLKLLGWRFGLRSEINPRWPSRYIIECWWSPELVPFAESELPAVESDPATSESLFLEFCEKRQLAWAMSRNTSGRIGLSLVSGDCVSVSINVNGSNPSEARARAILAASESMKK